MNLRNINITLLLFGVLFTSVSAWSLAPDPKHVETMQALVEQLEKRHYRSMIYNNSLSEKHLTAYLDSLDPLRMYFTKMDVDQFMEHRLLLDDQIQSGDLQTPFLIFTQYEAAFQTRIAWVIDNLPTWIKTFDYSRSEYIDIDLSEQHWALNAKELDHRWRLRLKNQVLSLRLAEKSIEEIGPTLLKRYRRQLTRVGQFNAEDVFQVFANSLAELYDPHTSYFSPRRAENFDINMSLRFDGIGAVLQLEDELTKVQRLLPGGPAEKQGDLKPSEFIVGVAQGLNGEFEDVIGWRLDEVVELIRGPRKTIVKLEVIPDIGRLEDRREVLIERNEVQLEEQAAKGSLLKIKDFQGTPRSIGVIDVPAFYLDFEAYRRGDKDYRSTTRDVARLIQELTSKGAEGLIIDLRSNGGGSLQEANELTGLFIEYGPTVQIRSSGKRIWRDGKRSRSPYYTGPIAVMINRLSASASEIFAGALQDYDRAIIVGDRSFGKGTVQTLIELPAGQLKVTESKFYRISGDSTQHRGVVPDIAFPSVFSHDEVGESSLDNALDWDQITPVRHRGYGSFAMLLPQLQAQHESRLKSDPDLLYLTAESELALETREMQSLPLNEAERVALRDQQEKAYLKIENNRRIAKGLAPINKLSDLDVEDETKLQKDVQSSRELNSDPGARTDNITEVGSTLEDDLNQESANDTLVTETGRILVDAISLDARKIVSTFGSH